MSDTPRILAIETSGHVGRVAVGSCAEDAVERRIDAPGRRHGQTLVAEIKGLLGDLDLAFPDLDGLAVSTGPGSFTGLRVGVVATKTIAYATKLPIVPIETFGAVAHQVARSGQGESRLLVFDDAQRGDLFVQAYDVDDQGAVPAGPVEIEARDAWIAARRATDLVAGPGCERFGGDLEGRCLVVAERLWRPTATAVVELGVRNLLAGSQADPVTLEPAYRRRSSAEVKWDERHGGDACED